MKWPDLTRLQIFHVVVCFVEENDMDRQRAMLEQIGRQRNVRLVVQPCPYEALAFLFQLDTELLSHQSGFDESVFCKVLMLKIDTPKETINAISDLYHAYFCAVIEQNPTQLKEHAKSLEKFNAAFQPPTNTPPRA